MGFCGIMMGPGPTSLTRQSSGSRSLAHCTTMSQDSLIALLSDDLLENIFLTSVNRTHPRASPIILSHVCRQWRAIARSSARLWTRIDMSSPERAARFFALSQQAALQVSWTLNPSRVDRCSWIWAHAHRFRELKLRASAPTKVVPLISGGGPQLGQLVMLAIIVKRGVAWQGNILPLNFQLPKLVSLRLT